MIGHCESHASHCLTLLREPRRKGIYYSDIGPTMSDVYVRHAGSQDRISSCRSSSVIWKRMRSVGEASYLV